MNRKSWRFLASALGLATAWSGSAHGATDYGREVQLPPFIVESNALPLPWRYAKFDQFEILSLCTIATTQEFARQLSCLEQELSWILPPQFRVKKSLPLTYILCDESMRRRLDRDIPVEAFLDSQNGPKSAFPPSPQKSNFVTIPHLGLQDDDADMCFMLVDNQYFDDGQIMYLPNAMENLLRQRTPPLPTWFISGFMYLYEAMSFNRNVRVGDHVHPLSVNVSPLTWISAHESQLMRIDPKEMAAASTLLPMEDLLVAPHPPREGVDQYRRVWICQAALFVRWALDNNTPGSRESFWNFLARASTEPVTESMFGDYFGLNYDLMSTTLREYLVSKALHRSADLGINRVWGPPPIAVTDATPAEVGRIKGDWERLEAAVEKKAYPGLSGAYLAQAHQTLWHDYDRGDRDPRLLAAMGLFECDAGDDQAALPLLTAAVQARVVRPKAYFELARILYVQELAKPAGTKGKLSAAQTASIQEILAAGRKQLPPLPQACELCADVWLHSDLAPAPSDLAELDEETLLFPRNFLLIYQTAVLDVQGGRLMEAKQIIGHGLENTTDEPSKARLQQLQASLLSPK